MTNGQGCSLFLVTSLAQCCADSTMQLNLSRAVSWSLIRNYSTPHYTASECIRLSSTKVSWGMKVRETDCSLSLFLFLYIDICVCRVMWCYGACGEVLHDHLRAFLWRPPVPRGILTPLSTMPWYRAKLVPSIHAEDLTKLAIFFSLWSCSNSRILILNVSIKLSTES